MKAIMCISKSTLTRYRMKKEKTKKYSEKGLTKPILDAIIFVTLDRGCGNDE